MARINIDHLRTLVEVSKHGNFTRAGNHLGLTQSAISLQIRELERRFNVQLVERLGRRAHLTEAGLALIDFANRIGRELDAMDAAMERFQHGSTARVRLGTSTTTLTYLLAPILKALHAGEHNLKVLVSIGTTQELLELIRDNDLDVGIITLPINEKQFTVIPVHREELKAILPAHMPNIPAAVTPQYMAELPLIVDHRAAVLKTMVAEWFSSQDCTMRAHMELEHLQAIRSAVVAGLGAAIVPAMVASDMPKSMDCEVRSLKPKLQRTIGLVHRSDKEITPAISTVIQAITAGVKAQQAR